MGLLHILFYTLLNTPSCCAVLYVGFTWQLNNVVCDSVHVHDCSSKRFYTASFDRKTYAISATSG